MSEKCGCHIETHEAVDPSDSLLTRTIAYCPMHAAVPDLVKACRSALRVMELEDDGRGDLPGYLERPVNECLIALKKAGIE